MFYRMLKYRFYLILIEKEYNNDKLNNHIYDK